MASLIIIAGPNGAGKSTSSSSILRPLGIRAFDFDKVFYEKWSKFEFDPSIQEGIKNATLNEFQEHLEFAYKEVKNVAFETNYNSEFTLSHIDAAKSFGFTTELIFIGLESEELAIKRVAERVKDGGHPVNESTIRKRYKAGIRLLDRSFHLYDIVNIWESPPNYQPTIECIAIDEQGIKVFKQPSFFNCLPELQKEIAG